MTFQGMPEPGSTPGPGTPVSAAASRGGAGECGLEPEPGYRSRPLMRRLAGPICIILFFALYAPITYYRALTAEVFFDENIALSRASNSPLVFDESVDYWYAIDHPAMYHWVNRTTLRLLGIEIGKVPDVDPAKSYDWNIEHGRAAPRRPVMALRVVSATALLLAFAALFFLSRVALGSWVWGLLVVAPLALPPAYGTVIAGYIQTDAYLALFFALSGLAMVAAHMSKRPLALWRVIAVSAVTGLAVSAKYNGPLVLFAYMTYLAVMSAGRARLWRPLLAAGVAFIVFCLINPVMWQVPHEGGWLTVVYEAPLYWGEVVHDVLRHRFIVFQVHEQFFGAKSRLALVRFAFPMWYLAPVFAALVYAARRERWFLPVAVWAAFLIVGTALSINQPMIRYRLPLDMGFATLVLLSTAAVALKLARRQVTLENVAFFRT